MSLSISTGGPTPADNNVPSSSEMNAYKEGIQGKDPKELINDLNKPGLEPWKKDAIIGELASQAQKNKESQGSGGAGGADGGGDSQDDIQKLLKKLMDGSISPEEMQKLAGALGIKPEDLEAMKGKGGDAGGGGDSGGDIQGG